MQYRSGGHTSRLRENLRLLRLAELRRREEISPEQKRWRSTLNAAMRPHGFATDFREWWHFSFTGAPEPRAYDFAIGPRKR
jgi:D-alanyl-D-alanine dipeptidase